MKNLEIKYIGTQKGTSFYKIFAKTYMCITALSEPQCGYEFFFECKDFPKPAEAAAI